MAYSLSPKELEEIYNFALETGRNAGKILIDGVERRTGDSSKREVEGKMEEKMNAVDIVTQTDLGKFPFASLNTCQLSGKSVRVENENSEADTKRNVDVEAFVRDEIVKRFPKHK